MNIRFHSILVVSSALLLSAGCSLFDSDDTSTERGGRTTSGNVPRAADSVREGRGELSYTADADGTIYIMNTSTEETVLTRPIRRGQRVEVTPDADRIRIDDETVSSDNLERDDEHRIYLVRNREAGRDSSDRLSNERPPRGVPGSAQMMGEGENRELSFRPSQDGSVYVYDVDDRRMVSKIPIRRGEAFVLSPGRSRATVDGRAVEGETFDTESTYRVYFNRED